MKTNKKGYFEFTLCGGRKKYNSIMLSSEDGEVSKRIKFIGTYQDDGYLEEMITGIKFKYINDVEELQDRRVYLDHNVVEILPDGEYYSYYSEPCYASVSEVSMRDAFDMIQSVRDVPNGMRRFKDIISGIVGEATVEFLFVKDQEPYCYEPNELSIEEEEVSKDRKVDKDGFYKLTLSDGEKYYKSVDVGLDENIPIIGEFRDGVMRVLGSDTELAFIREVEEIHDRRRMVGGQSFVLLPKDEYHSYFSQPCYYRGQEMNRKIVSKILILFRSQSSILQRYISGIEKILMDSTLGFQAVCNSSLTSFREPKKDKKPRALNKYKIKREEKPLVKKQKRERHCKNYYKKIKEEKKRQV